MEKSKGWIRRMVKDILKEIDKLGINDDIQDDEIEIIVKNVVSKYIEIV